MRFIGLELYQFTTALLSHKLGSLCPNVSLALDCAGQARSEDGRGCRAVPLCWVQQPVDWDQLLRKKKDCKPSEWLQREATEIQATDFLGPFVRLF